VLRGNRVIGVAEIQFAAQAYTARSPQLLSQQCINAFVEPTPREGKTVSPVYGSAGLTLFSRQGQGPIIGMHVFDLLDLLFVLSNKSLYSVTAQGSATFIGDTTLGGLSAMADNGAQLVMTDGSAAWIYQPGGLNIVTISQSNPGDATMAVNLTGKVTAGDTLNIPLDIGTIWTTTAAADTPAGYPTSILLSATLPSTVSAGAIITDPANVLGQILAPAFMSASTVQFFDGYFVYEAAGTRQFFISGLNDGTQYSALDFATASAASDKCVAVVVYHEQLLVFCSKHTEVWWDTGNATFPFQRYDAALIARGLIAPYAVCSEDNTVFWMGDDGVFYRLEGFLPKRISTYAGEHAWANYPNKYLDCSCFVLNQEGHKFIFLNFPSAPATWCFDISSGLWHERESWGTAWV
jgi:hypothetical protein